MADVASLQPLQSFLSIPPLAQAESPDLGHAFLGGGARVEEPEPSAPVVSERTRKAATGNGIGGDKTDSVGPPSAQTDTAAEIESTRSEAPAERSAEPAGDAELICAVTVTYFGDRHGKIGDSSNTIAFENTDEWTLSEAGDRVDGRLDGAGMTIDAEGGNDTMQGGSGADVLRGGVGADTLPTPKPLAARMGANHPRSGMGCKC